MAVTGGTVTFAMSTETTNGITVTAGATISRDTDDIAEYTLTRSLLVARVLLAECHLLLLVWTV